MSSSLMSCVRENSPPLEYEDTRNTNRQPIPAGGPQSLPPTGAQEIYGNENFSDKPLTVKSSTMMTSNIDGSGDGGVVGVTPPNAEQQKRRRFHMLRNLGRIFRRRTITSINDAPTAAVTASSAASAHTRTLPVTRIGTQPVSSTSEKNLRSATLNSMSSMPSASSPSSPLTHQQLQEAYNSQSLPKSKTYANSTQLQRDVLLLGKNSNTNIGSSSNNNTAHQKRHQTLQHDSNAETSTDFDISIDEQNANVEMYATTTTTTSSTAYHHHHQHHHQRMNHSIGVAVLPPIGDSSAGGHRSRNFFLERQKLRSLDDLEDESAGKSSSRRLETCNGLQNSSSNSGEITDSQRSLSEGRLVDSDITREGLSQSHDSVFSESATASSLSIGLRAELADVLRKRRTRPDGSDEDLGLPRSPGSPQRRAEQLGHYKNKTTNAVSNYNNNNNTNQSEISSMSLLSMNSNDCEDFQATSTANNSLIEQHQSTTTTKTATRYVRSATFSSMPTEIFRHQQMRASLNETTKDEVDLSNLQRLSHSAAKHKIAIRPVKKHMPTRQHRRTLETSIPEANENVNVNKTGSSRNLLATSTNESPNSNNLSDSSTLLKADLKTTKSTTDPPKLMDQQQQADATTIASKKSTKTKITNTAAITGFETNKSTKLVSETCESTTKISNLSNKMAGIRAGFSTNNKTTTTLETSTNKIEESTLETTDSGFLRRLMPRNSKRNYANVAGDDDTDKQIAASEPKKIPISTSCFEMATNNSQASANVEKVKSAMSYEQSIEEKRKVIKREILNEGTNGLSAILNNFALTTDSANQQQPSTSSNKPKSGPAARQRYIPQDIAIPQQESFESVSMVRNVIKASPTKSPHRNTDASTSSATQQHHHHFEKKPKIVGLSAFQQKISRSNDSVVRTSASNNSLETTTNNDEYDELQIKQRKSVEKSRSFRTYNEEQRYERINMPSLPDLTLNLRVPNYTQQFILQEKENSSSPSPPLPQLSPPHDKCASLGFEINDNTLLKPHISPRSAESIGNINNGNNSHTTANVVSPYKRNLIVTTSGSNLMNLSPSNSCQATTNITEIEQNIDMIMKSPFISVIRKSANLEQVDIKFEEEPEKKLRPKSLVLVQKTKSEEQLSSPTTAAVPLRSRLPSNDDQILKDERKSAPLTTNSPKSLKFPRRSLTEGGVNDLETQNEQQTLKSNDLPEFMKIQLNHVDQARLMVKSNVVLAKNVKEIVTTPTTPTATLMAWEKPFKTTHDQSVVNTERQTTEVLPKSPTKQNVVNLPTTTPLVNSTTTTQVVNKPKAITPVLEKQIVHAAMVNTSTQLVNRPKATTPVLEKPIEHAAMVNISTQMVNRPKATTPVLEKPIEHAAMVNISTQMVNRPKTTTPVLEKPIDRTPPTTPISPFSPISPPVEFRTKPEDSFTIANHKLSIQERKRLFLNETTERPSSIKKVEDIRTDRKKSLSDEVFRKLSTCGRQNEQTEKKVIESDSVQKSSAPTTPTKTLTLNTTMINTSNSNNSPVIEKMESNVILRKKSFASNSIINNNPKKDDSTPELMKVFARRSLKVKDEDIAGLTEKIHEKKMNGTNQNPPQTTSSTTSHQQHQQQQQQNVDSDKENQSSSEEKLYKLSVDMEQMSSVSKITNNKLQTSTTNNRNSVADFRHQSPKNGNFYLNNNNSSNNNNNNATNASISNNKSQLPPIKLSSGQQQQRGSISNGISKPSSAEATKLLTKNVTESNNNNKSMTTTITTTNSFSSKRQSFNIKNIENPSSPSNVNADPSTNKSIERSATVGEFKGIHQRRAEWEQRAKEASSSSTK